VSGIRTEPTLGNEAREGPGKPGREPDEPRKTEGRGRCDVRRRRERSPDGPHRHDRQEGCLDRPRDPLPTSVEACPPLPAQYHHALDAGLSAIALRLSSDARATIDGHVRLLLAWNAAINLTAIREPAEIAVRHVLDSLTGLRILESRHVLRFLDLGSGGGYPGLPLIAAMAASRVRLIESVAKKARFLDTVVAATGLGALAEVLPIRAEALAIDAARTGRVTAVTARAVAPLAELVELSFPILGSGGWLVAWKSASAVASDGPELAAARRAIAVIDPAATISIEPALPAAVDPGNPAISALADHQLVIIERRAERIDGAWPRNPATRRRQPW
jgi:16S rRNA (guanine527-N7)-methyltransferase